MKTPFRKLVAFVGGCVFLWGMGCAVAVESAVEEEEVGEAQQAICAHAICSTGPKLSASCDLCAQKICAKDPYCCTTYWDSVCVGEVTSVCGQSCSAPPPPPPPPPPPTCSHGECTAGAPLAISCDTCAYQVCSQLSYCCTSSWDAQCVSTASSLCGLACGAPPGGTCLHSECATGNALILGCDACVNKVCGADPYCCNYKWDATCVSEAKTMCSLTCP